MLGTSGQLSQPSTIESMSSSPVYAALQQPLSTAASTLYASMPRASITEPSGGAWISLSWNSQWQPPSATHPSAAAILIRRIIPFSSGEGHAIASVRFRLIERFVRVAEQRLHRLPRAQAAAAERDRDAWNRRAIGARERDVANRGAQPIGDQAC